MSEPVASGNRVTSSAVSFYMSKSSGVAGRFMVLALLGPLLLGCNREAFGVGSGEEPTKPSPTCRRNCSADAGSTLEPSIEDGGGRRGKSPVTPSLADGGDAAFEGDPIFVRMGVPLGETLKFGNLETGGDIRVQAGGQGSSHALLALQCAGLGDRVFFSATVRNLDGEGEVSNVELPRPRPIACDDEGLCRIVPIVVPLGGVAPRAEWDGLHVEVSATVRGEDGLERTGTAVGYLREDEPYVPPAPRFPTDAGIKTPGQQLDAAVSPDATVPLDTAATVDAAALVEGGLAPDVMRPDAG